MKRRAGNGALRLGDCESVVVAAPFHLAGRPAPQEPTGLDAHNCLTYSYFGKSVWRFDAAGEGEGKRELLASGQLAELLPDWRPQAMGIDGVYTSREPMPPALRAMLDHLAAWFAQEPALQACSRRAAMPMMKTT